jgi:hypothetical protein
VDARELTAFGPAAARLRSRHARRSRRALALAAAGALAVGFAAGGLLVGGAADAPAPQPSAITGDAVGLPAASYALQAQRLQSALAVYGLQAVLVRTPADARAHGVLLQRAEESLADVARAASGLATPEGSAVGDRARRLREQAIGARVAAQAPTAGAAEILALRGFGQDVQRTGSRLESLLAVLTTATTADAYALALSGISAEIAGIDPAGPAAPAAAVPNAADDPVPAG